MRLTCHDAALLSDEMAAGLMGPGAPFELVLEEVLGRKVEVFAQRPAHLRALLERAAGTHSDLPYLVSDDRQFTFREAHDRVALIAAVLASRGVRRGDRVALIAANSIDHALTVWAVISLGAVVVSLNGWWTGPEIEDGIALTRPELIVGDATRLARVRENAPHDRPLVDLDDLAAEADQLVGGRLPDGEIHEDDPAAIMFTSGTTGRARGAVLSHRNFVHFAHVSLLGGAIASLSTGTAPPEGQPASISGSPFFHVSGATPLLANAPFIGIKLVLPPVGKWDPVSHLQLTEAHRISSWSGVPTQLWRLLEHPRLGEFDLSSLRTVGLGGAPCSPDLQRLLAERLPDVRLTNGYGMTETTGTGTWSFGDRVTRVPNGVGSPTPGQEIELRDDEGRPTGPDEVGEICIRGAGVFLGYWGDDEATARCLDDDRWYRTGDYGRVVDDDVLVIESRIRDLIIRGGENVYPIEIEHRLVAHPDVDDAAVIGIPHRQLGQEVKAIVVRREGAAVTAEQLQRWVGEVLAPFKVPAQVEFCHALPYNTTGKVLKDLLVPSGSTGGAGR